jgi:hypothetical protein
MSLSEAVFVTKKIDLPSQWARLVARYASVVPAYDVPLDFNLRRSPPARVETAFLL